MKKNTPNPEQGFISIILLIIVALVVLYYLHIPLNNILSTPTAQEIGSTLKNILTTLWQDFVLLFQFGKAIVTGGK